MKALQLIVALALLVIVHEFGHYIIARAFGIKVEKFYLFFNPWFSLLKWKPKQKGVKYDKHGNVRATWRDTEYGIGWLPLGGYVKIAGTSRWIRSRWHSRSNRGSSGPSRLTSDCW